jgi:hypothetical protein
MYTCNTVLLSLLDGLTISLLALAGLALFRHRGLPLAEAAAFALMTTLMLLSALWQLAFLFNCPFVALTAEAFAACLSLFLILRWRAMLKRSWQGVRFVNRIHPFFSGALILGLLLIITQILCSPLPASPVYGFWPSALNDASGPEVADVSRLLPSLNVTVFFYRQMHWGACCGRGWIGLTALGSIGFATYALARRYAWPPTSMAVAFTVICLPPFVRFVYDGGLVSAAAASAVFGVLLIYRLADRPNRLDLSYLPLALMFCVTSVGLYYGLPLMLAGLTLMVLMRRYDLVTWRDHLRKFSPDFLAVLALGVLFSQIIIVLHNRHLADDWFVTADLTVLQFNADGIEGAGVNFLRYLHSALPQSLSFGGLLAWCLGLDAQAVDRLLALLGLTAIDNSFGYGAGLTQAMVDSGTRRGFGLLGSVLMPLCWLYAVWRGSRRLRTMVIWLLAYGYVLVLVPAWSIQHPAFFSPLFACGGFMLAFLLPPWRFTRRGRHGILWISLISFFVSILS